MEFVKDDRPHPLQGGIVQQHPCEDALCDHLHAGFGAYAAFQADAVAHRLPHLLPQEPGHAGSHLPGRHPPGLQENHLPLRKGLRNGQRQHGGFTRPGRRRHNDAPPLRQDAVHLPRNPIGRQGSNLRMTGDSQCMQRYR